MIRFSLDVVINDKDIIYNFLPRIPPNLRLNTLNYLLNRICEEHAAHIDRITDISYYKHDDHVAWYVNGRLVKTREVTS